MKRRDFLGYFPASVSVIGGAFPAFARERLPDGPMASSDRTKFVEAYREALFWAGLVFGTSVTLPRLQVAWDLSRDVSTSEERCRLARSMQWVRAQVRKAQEKISIWGSSPGVARNAYELAENLLWVGRYKEALQYFPEKQEGAFGDLEPNAGILHTYFCMGDYEGGLAAMTELSRGLREDDYWFTWMQYEILLLAAIPRPLEAQDAAERMLERVGYSDPVAAHALSKIEIDLFDLSMEMEDAHRMPC